MRKLKVLRLFKPARPIDHIIADHVDKELREGGWDLVSGTTSVATILNQTRQTYDELYVVTLVLEKEAPARPCP